MSYNRKGFNNGAYNPILNAYNDSSHVCSIEKKINNLNDEYIIQLFIQYLNHNLNYDEKQIIKKIINRQCNVNEVKLIINDLIKQNNYKIETLVDLYPDFASYVDLVDRTREYYLYHLTKENINMDSEDTYELNKGEFDTATTSSTSIISKYGNTLELDNNVLYKYNGILYNVYENGDFIEIPEGSTFIIHNPYNTKEILYNLSVLAGTNNTVVLGTWGLNKFDKLYKKKIERFLSIINVLSIDNRLLSNDITFNCDGITCNSFVINTKNLKSNIDFNGLLSYREKNIIKNSFNIFDDNFISMEDHIIQLEEVENNYPKKYTKRKNR